MARVYRAMHAFDLDEWPEIKSRLDSTEVVNALTAYTDAYTTDKLTIEAHDAYDMPSPKDQEGLETHWAKIGQLRRACTISRRLKKMAWRKLMDVLEEDYDTTSTDEEDSGDD
jgi:hypothetical protein